MAFLDELNNLERKEKKEFDHLAVAQKLYNQTLEYILSDIKSKIKKQVLKNNAGTRRQYTGNIPLDIHLECPGTTRIYGEGISKADYSWYYILDHYNDYESYYELKLKKIYVEKTGHKFLSFVQWIELSEFGARFITDLVSLCRKEGIEIDYYLEASYINNVGKEIVLEYERVEFGEKLNTRYQLRWSLKANYNVS